MNTLQSILLPISSIEPNKGQVKGIKSNPRTISKSDFKLLLKSLKESPEYLSINEIEVFPVKGKYIIINGNMRYEAALKLGYTEIPAKVIPKGTPLAKLNEYIAKGNAHYGEWDWDMFANEWDSEKLREWGVKMPDWGAEEKPKQSGGKANKITITLDEEGETWEIGGYVLSAGDKISLSEIKDIIENMSE